MQRYYLFFIYFNIYLKKVFLAGLLTSIQNLFSIKIRANTSHEVSALIYLV